MAAAGLHTSWLGLTRLSGAVPNSPIPSMFFFIFPLNVGRYRIMFRTCASERLRASQTLQKNFEIPWMKMSWMHAQDHQNVFPARPPKGSVHCDLPFLVSCAVVGLDCSSVSTHCLWRACNSPAAFWQGCSSLAAPERLNLTQPTRPPAEQRAGRTKWPRTLAPRTASGQRQTSRWPRDKVPRLESLQS